MQVRVYLVACAVVLRVRVPHATCAAAAAEPGSQTQSAAPSPNALAPPATLLTRCDKPLACTQSQRLHIDVGRGQVASLDAHTTHRRRRQAALCGRGYASHLMWAANCSLQPAPRLLQGQSAHLFTRGDSSDPLWHVYVPYCHLGSTRAPGHSADSTLSGSSLCSCCRHPLCTCLESPLLRLHGAPEAARCRVRRLWRPQCVHARRVLQSRIADGAPICSASF